MVRLEPERTRKALPERAQKIGEVGAKIRKAPFQTEVEHDVDQRMPQPVLPRIVRSV